jgi:hypothetical protein
MKFAKFSTHLSSFFLLTLVSSGIYNSFIIKLGQSRRVFDDSKFTLMAKVSEQFSAKKYSSVQIKYDGGQRVYAEAATLNVSDPPEEYVEKESYFQQDLDLELVEFFNRKHFDRVLKNNEIDGSLVIAGGEIELMEILLPNEDEILIESRQIAGNTFNYNYLGQDYSGMLFQSGNNQFTVSLVNGPYQGSKMKFMNPVSGSRSLSNEGEPSREEELPYERMKEPEVFREEDTRPQEPREEHIRQGPAYTQEDANYYDQREGRNETPQEGPRYDDTNVAHEKIREEYENDY